MGLLGSNQNNVELYHGIRTNAAILGIPIPLLFGQGRLSMRLIDYNDFTINKAKQQGGKGLAKGGTQYVYSASIIAALAQGPINTLLNVWDSTGRFVLLSTQETYTVSSGSGYQYTPNNAAIFGNDQGVFSPTAYTVGPFTDYGGSPTTLTGTQNIPLTQVSGSPGTGQYNVNPTTGVYTFSSADAGVSVVVNYSYYRYQIITEELTIVPFSGPYTITVDNSTNFLFDEGVEYYPSGIAFTFTSGTPGVGQYSRSGATYTFNIVDSGQAIVISYIYKDPNTDTNAPTTLNFTLVNGALGQAATSYMTGKHPSKAIGYSQLAYIFSSGLYLGYSPELPNYSFEVAGNFQFGAGIVDANPADCIIALLTNTAFGAGFPLSFIQPSFLVPGSTGLALAVDSFHRANQNPINTNWKVIGSFVLGQVLSNLYVGQNAAATDMCYDGGISWPNDQFSQATLRTLNVGKGYAGLYVRTSTAFGHGYQFLLDGVFNGTQGIGHPTGAKLNIGGGGGTSTVITPQSGDVFRMEARGNKISVFQNGTLILSLVDSTWTSGKPGIFASPTNGVATDVAWDDWSAGSLASNTVRSCWTANSFFISPLIENQDTCAQIISRWLEAGMVAAFFSEAQLKFVPYGDSTAVGNGVIYAPSTTPVANITDDQYIVKDKNPEDPVKVERSAWQDAYNRCQISYRARVNDYNPEVIYEQDEASIGRYGLLIEDPQEYDFICILSAAQYAASMRVQRKSYIRNTYMFALPDTFAYLEPMDVITLNDTVLGLGATPVRITKIEDDPKEGLSITAEDFLWGTAAPAFNPKNINSPYLLDLGQQDPGSIQTPIIFEANNRVTQGLGYEIWIGAAGLNPNWGGCHVWLSRDNVNFVQIEDINGDQALLSPSRMGVATTALPYHTDPDGGYGPNAPTAAADVSVSLGVAWTNPTNIEVSDGVFATVTFANPNVSDLLEATGFGFSIGATETIMGIQVDVQGMQTHSGIGDLVPNCSVVLLKAGSVVGSAINGQFFKGQPNSFTSFGGPLDLWGTTWAPSDINASNFGAAFQAKGFTVGVNDTWSIDFMRITVYTTAGQVTVTLSISTETLGSGTAADANNLATLCLLDNELFSYQSSTLVSTGTYTLGTLLRRGQLGSQITNHAVGAPFLRIDNSIFRYPLDPTSLGQPLYFKFTSFNLLGNQEQSLANVPSYPITPTGLNPTNFPTAPSSVLIYATATNAGATASFIRVNDSSGYLTRQDGSKIPVAELISFGFGPIPGTIHTIAGGSLGSRTEFFKFTVVDSIGRESLPCAEQSLSCAANTLSQVVLTTPAGYVGSIAYNVYASTTTGTETLQNTTPIPYGTAWNEPLTGLTTTGVSFPLIDTSGEALPAVPALSQVAGGSLGARTRFVRVAYIRNGYLYGISGEISLAVSANNLLTVTGPVNSLQGLYVTVASDPSATWTNPTHFQGAPDGSYATIVAGILPTASVIGDGYGFSLGSAASIKGIVAVITSHWTLSSGTLSNAFITAQLTVGGSPIGVAKTLAINQTTDTAVSFGSANDTWGATLTPAIVNDPTFGLLVSASTGTLSGSANIFLDSGQLNIFANGGTYDGWVPLVSGVTNTEVVQPNLPLVGFGATWTEPVAGATITGGTTYLDDLIQGGIHLWELSPGGTYYLYPYYNTTTGLIELPAGGIPTAASQTAASIQNAQGNVTLSNGALVVTVPSGGGGSGGGSGGGGKGIL